MARIDDYRESFRLASSGLRERGLKRIVEEAGRGLDLIEQGGPAVRLCFLGVPHVVKVGDEVKITREDTGVEVPLTEKIIISHYLLGLCSASVPAGRFISFRQVPDGQFYFAAFQRRARDPFIKAFGEAPDAFRSCAAMLGGKPVAEGDAAMEFNVLPNIPVKIILWRGDEEFPPDAGILFDSNISHCLSAEDIATLGGMLVYRLAALAATVSSGPPDAAAGEKN